MLGSEGANGWASGRVFGGMNRNLLALALAFARAACRCFSASAYTQIHIRARLMKMDDQQ